MDVTSSTCNTMIPKVSESNHSLMGSPMSFPYFWSPESLQTQCMSNQTCRQGPCLLPNEQAQKSKPMGNMWREAEGTVYTKALHATHKNNRPLITLKKDQITQNTVWKDKTQPAIHIYVHVFRSLKESL